MLLKDKIAIVTGAGREGKGIGRFISLALAKEGASIVIADFVKEAADAVAAEVEALGVKALSIKTDVSQSADADALVQATLDAFGRIDILVNNAGITRDALLMKMTDEQWDSVLATNLKGTFNCTRAVSRQMLRQRSGRIVNIASVMGIMGNIGQANYSASKGGVIALTKTTARELGSRGITVNAIAPGFIQTAMTEELPEQVRENIGKQIPLARLGSPEDVAGAVVFLCSDAASYITGQTLNVDGGMVM